MARIPTFDPLTSEARSPLIAGLTEACSKLSSILDLHTDEAYDMPLSPIYVSKDDKYRLWQAPLGNKLWLEVPTPVIRKNGIVITPQTDGFTIDYFGGSIAFDNNKQLDEFDVVTADFTYIVDSSNTIEQIISDIEAVGLNANKFRGYYSDVTSAVSSIANPVGGDYFLVGGEENNIYIWNSTDSAWKPVYKETDLSNYYDKSETDSLLNQKEPNIIAHGGTPNDDDYYYGGRKTWVNVNDKVKGTTLDNLDTSSDDKVTNEDNVLSAVGKLQGQIDNFVHDIFGDANPTVNTVGKIGQDYTNTSTGDKFHLIEIAENGDYIWESYSNSTEMNNVKSQLNSAIEDISDLQDGKADKVSPAVAGHLVILDSSGNILDSGKGVDDVGKLPTLHEVTLFVSGWVGTEAPYTQTVTIIGVIANEGKQIIRVSPNPVESDITDAMDCSVYCTAQGNNSLTFTAFDDKPTNDIVFNVEVQDLIEEKEIGTYTVKIVAIPPQAGNSLTYTANKGGFHTIIANPKTGYVFSKFVVNGVEVNPDIGTTDRCTITINSDMYVEVFYEEV